MEYELNIDPKVICRICLAENTLKTIFCNEIVNGSIVPFPKVFESVTGCKVTKDDGFPQNVCNVCRQTVNESYVLKQKYTNNQALLGGILNICIATPEVQLPKVTSSVGTQTDPKQPGTHLSTQTTSPETRDHGIQANTVQSTRNMNTQTRETRTQSEHAQTDPITSTDVQTDVVQTDMVDPEADSPLVKMEFTTDGRDQELPMLNTESDTKSNEYYSSIEVIIEDPAEGISMVSFPGSTIPEGEEVLDAEYLIDEYDETAADDATSTQGDYEAVFECGKCNRLFDTESELEHHDCRWKSRKVKRSNKPRDADLDHLVCKLCRNHSKNEADFIEHQQLHKITMPLLLDSVYYFRCGTCHLVYMTVEDLQKHLSAGKCEKFVTDELCTDYQFLVDDGDDASDYERDNLASRICSIVKVDDEQLTCNWCMDFTAASTLEVWQHFTATHIVWDPNDETPTMQLARTEFNQSFSTAHKCGYCDEPFRWLRDAIPHVFLHAETFVCPFPNCNEFYLRFYLLNTHMHLKHMNEEKRTCDHCGVWCETHYQLRAHMRRDCKALKFACQQCDKRFYTRNNLLMHSKIHSIGRRFQCSYCGKRFANNGDKKTHERIHTGDKPYSCPMCDLSFRSIGNRKDHMATHNDDESMRVECKICNLSFKSERILRGHMAIHDEQRRFKCDLCGKEFYRKYHMTKHMRTHKTV